MNPLKKALSITLLSFCGTLVAAPTNSYGDQLALQSQLNTEFCECPCLALGYEKSPIGNNNCPDEVNSKAQCTVKKCECRLDLGDGGYEFFEVNCRVPTTPTPTPTPIPLKACTCPKSSTLPTKFRNKHKQSGATDLKIIDVCQSAKKNKSCGVDTCRYAYTNTSGQVIFSPLLTCR